MVFISNFDLQVLVFVDFRGAQIMVFHASLVFKFCMCFDLCALSALRENHEKKRGRNMVLAGCAHLMLFGRAAKVLS